MQNLLVVLFQGPGNYRHVTGVGGVKNVTRPAIWCGSSHVHNLKMQRNHRFMSSCFLSMPLSKEQWLLNH